MMAINLYDPTEYHYDEEDIQDFLAAADQSGDADRVRDAGIVAQAARARLIDELDSLTEVDEPNVATPYGLPGGEYEQ